MCAGLTREFIITGTSRGLGSSLFDLLIEAGHRPIAVGRSLAPHHSCRGKSDFYRFIKIDFSILEQVDAIDFKPLMRDSFNQIVFINNAGTVDPIGLVTSLKSPEVMAAFAINAIAPALVATKLLALADARGANLYVLNITTGAAQRPQPGLGAYAASKAANLMFLNTLFAERPDVEIDHTDPGVLDTDMQTTLRDTSDSIFPARNIFQRWAEEGKLQNPREIAKSILESRALL